MPVPPVPVPVEQLHRDVHQALKQWDNARAPSSLDYLRLFRIALPNGGSPREVTNRLLLAAMTELAQSQTQEDADFVMILRGRFVEREPARVIAARLNLAEPTIRRKQNQAIFALAEILRQQEQDAHAAHQSTIAASLDAPAYDKLFGIEPHLDKLRDLLTTPEERWLIALEGIGGIGKTSLADAFVRTRLGQLPFVGCVWLSAQQHRLHLGRGIQPVDGEPALTADALLDQLAQRLLPETPLNRTVVESALQEYLQQHPHLIVIDNLETVHDTEALMPILYRLATPSKFLLTTRYTLFAETGVYPFPVPQLSRDLALALIRHEAAAHNLPALASSSDAELDPIYDTVGGNPLALRLVVGQMYLHPFDVVLNALNAVQGRAVEQLYTFIYRHAWESLDETARHVLLATPFLPHAGGSFAHLRIATELDTPVLLDALETLVSLNLVDRRRGHDHPTRADHLHHTGANGTGDRDDGPPSYAIHSLTRTFLEDHVIPW